MPFGRRRSPSPPLSQSSSSGTTDNQKKPAKKPISLRTLFSSKERVAISPHSHAEPLTQNPATTPASTPKPDQASPTPKLESSTTSHQDQEEAQFLWEDIDPPAEFFTSLNQSPPPHSDTQGASDAAMLNSNNLNIRPPSSTNASASLPGYNDVSGAVVVDWNGYPHFLSPQEERDRQLQLENAVRERMLGLPHRTDFVWEQTSGPVLPQYSPVKEKKTKKRSSRSSRSSQSSLSS